ncbi:unnamed protein product [Ilex paraguariensis]
MPRAKAKSAAAPKVDLEKLAEPKKLNDSDERVDLDGDTDNEEVVDEESEYEEVEEVEEIEVEEEEEVEEIEEEEDVEEEEEEEEMEEEEEEEEDGSDLPSEADAEKSLIGGNRKVDHEDECNKHAQLLALPPHGSEVYIGGIPQDASEENLRGFSESVGEVTEVKIMKGKEAGNNKGFAFVTFRSVELAAKAIEKLNNSEFMGRKIKCSKSQAKHRLFIGNVPRNWGDADIKKAVTQVGPGVTSVELVKDMKNRNNSRGFAFIDYYNHACAEYSRQKMMNSEFKLDDNAPTVSWADPKNADSSPASQVKAVYVKNLPIDTTQDMMRKLFEHHGKIIKVVLLPANTGHGKNRIGFVHFAERSSALKALKNTEKYEIDGQLLQCSLAKPQAEQKSVGGSNSQKSGLLPSHPSRAGYGLLGGAYGALGAGYGAAAFAQV